MPLARHDLAIAARPSFSLEFLLTCLLRGMTRRSERKQRRDKFLLTCLLRGMTGTVERYAREHQFLLTCLLRGMTSSLSRHICPKPVSTHMPLARHDMNTWE